MDAPHHVPPVQTVLDTAVDAIISIDARGRVQLFNRAAEQLFGYVAGEVIGRNVNLLMPEPYASEHDEYLGRYLATGRKSIIGIGREVTARRKDGSTFPAELAVGEAPGEQVHRFIGFVRDLTEKKQLERRSLRSQRLEAIGTLAGGIAHDLNNVLTPILMAVQLLRRDQPAEARKELLDTAQASVERGTALIKQMLAFAGGGPAARTAIDVGALVVEVRSLLEHTLPKSVALQTEASERLWAVSGDATQLSQVLMNLCVNGRDAMPEGGSLTIAAENVTLTQPMASVPDNVAPGRYVRLTITDTGSGIPAAILDQIFDPFFTTKEFGKGTGLGLSTVLGIVRGHGGAINVYSEPGRGTRVSVYLPALVGPGETTGLDAVEAYPHGHGELVLVVDDEPAILTTVRLVLESAGYRVMTASGGAEALNLWRRSEGKIAAVLLDMMMPGLDGLATMAELAKLDAAARVIAASGLRRADVVQGNGPLRPRAFLQKPYAEDQLLRTLDEVLRG